MRRYVFTNIDGWGGKQQELGNACGKVKGRYILQQQYQMYMHT